MSIKIKDWQNIPQLPSTKFMLYFDKQLNDWQLHPFYIQQFTLHANIIKQLRQTTNKTWTEKQLSSFITFLDHLNKYIEGYVLKRVVHYYEDFLSFVEEIKIFNPIGSELYEEQLEQLQKRQANQSEQQGEKQKQESKKQDYVQTAKNEKQQIVQNSFAQEKGPQIDLKKLYETNWDKNKYISMKSLQKQNVSIALIGQTHSGKSTLTGSIISQLQEEQVQTLKPQRSSQKDKAHFLTSFSNIYQQERQDGRTRQFAKFNFSLEKRRITLFDTPGHKDYVCNMITGLSQADIAILVISAKEGEFQSDFQKDDQMKKQTMIAKITGITEIIVAVTKMGTVSWSEQRFNFIKEKVSPYLQDTCGYDKVAYIPIDSIKNTNIHTKFENDWYNGPSLLDYLNNVKVLKYNTVGPLRISVNDKSKHNGSVYLFGKIESGTIIEQHSVTIHPQRVQFTIKEILNANEEKQPFAIAGENVKIKVKGIQLQDFTRGSIICNNTNNCRQSSQFKARITFFQLPSQKKLLSSGYTCLLYLHSLVVEVQIAEVKAKIQKETGNVSKSVFLRGEEEGICVIRVIDKPVCVEQFSFMPSLGRFFLRDEGKIIGYGQIIEVKPSKKVVQEREERLARQKMIMERHELQAAKKEAAKQEIAKKEAAKKEAAERIEANRNNAAFNLAVKKVADARRYFQNLQFQKQRQQAAKRDQERREYARNEGEKRRIAAKEKKYQQKPVNKPTMQKEVPKKEGKKRYVEKSSI